MKQPADTGVNTAVQFVQVEPIENTIVVFPGVCVCVGGRERERERFDQDIECLGSLRLQYCMTPSYGH